MAQLRQELPSDTSIECGGSPLLPPIFRGPSMSENKGEARGEGHPVGALLAAEGGGESEGVTLILAERCQSVFAT